MARLLRRGAALLGVLLAVAPGTAGAVPPVRIAAGVEVSATPIAPPQATEPATHCARSAPVAVDGSVLPAAHRLLGVARAWQFSRGAGVTVAVIDTGVAAHPRLPGLTGGGDYVSDGDGLDDCDLHGTLVAGIVAARPGGADAFAGVAPQAQVVSIRQSSGAFRAKTSRSDTEEASMGAGYGPLATLARAIVRAAELGAQVINISETACVPAGSDVDLRAVSSALAHARRRDAVVVAAAGNATDGSACREQNPAATASPESAWAQVRTTAIPALFGTEILTVGAVDASTGLAAEFSLRGPWVTVAAPGTGVVSVADGRLVAATDGPDGPRPLAGTSYAAAYAAGTAALVRSRFPELSADEVIDRIVRTARGGPHRDAALGFGVIDPVAALTAELPDADDLPDPSAGHPVTAPAPDPPAPALSGPLSAVTAVCAVLLIGVWAATRRRD